MQEKIGICIVGDGDLKQYNFVKDNLINTTKCAITIYYNEIKDSYTDSINELIAQVTEKYCVIFPINALVDINWCEDLLNNMKTANNPGIVGIRHSNNNLSLIPILFDEELKNVWMHEDNLMNGLIMFKRDIITSDFGMFEKIFDNSGYEFSCFSIKFFLTGLNNFYIRQQSFIAIESENKILFPEKTKEGFKLLNEFIKSNLKNKIKSEL
jgi:hypothetical protein